MWRSMYARVIMKLFRSFARGAGKYARSSMAKIKKKIETSLSQVSWRVMLAAARCVHIIATIFHLHLFRVASEYTYIHNILYYVWRGPRVYLYVEYKYKYINDVCLCVCVYTRNNHGSWLYNWTWSRNEKKSTAGNRSVYSVCTVYTHAHIILYILFIIRRLRTVLEATNAGRRKTVTIVRALPFRNTTAAAAFIRVLI